MAKVKQEQVEVAKEAGTSEIVKALVEAIELTRPVVKKTAATRKKNTPWTPKDGSVKPKLRRKIHQHGINLNAERLSSDEVNLLNKLKPGTYCDGHIKVNRRKDRSIDIDYPVKTASQRLRLINDFGIVSFKGLLEKLVEEAANPKKEDADLDE